MTAHLLDCTQAEYLADPAPEPSLSSSIANVLLDKSARHAWMQHPRLGGKPLPATDSMDRGSLLHTMLLGKGASVHVVDAPDWRTKAARTAREEARQAGKIPTLANTYAAVLDAATAIKRNMPMDLTGTSEVTILWQEDAAHGSIWCRSMLDHVMNGDGSQQWDIAIYDIKTTLSAHPDSCLRSAVNYGYDVQHEAYIRALEHLHPEHAGRIAFWFIFCEAEPPYSVTVAGLDSLMRVRGERRWREAVETWSRCLATDTWPGYASEPITLWSPSWLLNKESEAAAARGEDFTYER